MTNLSLRAFPRWRRGLIALALLLSPRPAAQAQAPAPAQSAASLLHDDEAPSASPLTAALRHARPLTLDVAAARAVLAAAPPEGSAAPLVLALPLPDGRTQRFAVTQTAVMAPELAARYPGIRTYAGRGLDDRTAVVRLDLTPAGFHAQVLSAATGTSYIDPTRRGDTRHYLSFFKRDMGPGGGAACGFRPDKAPSAAGGRRAAQNRGSGSPAQLVSGGALRTYRLAVAATGEYTAFHGGTVPLALAAIVTSVNRVVGVYEKELAVRMVLVAANQQVVYTNAATDPYTNNNGGIMLDENQAVLDSLIGSASYDIGHVFSTGGGGVAYYACVCGPNKAKGVTGLGAPVGDAFDIDYVAHEMGHQFSGSHPFNGDDGACNGNRSDDAAWEPGSGSTIMAYAGICDLQDLQSNSDAFFHVGNFEEMRGFIVTTPCAVLTVTGNATPRISGPASGKVLPMATPFRLTATATDADGDALTYSWEELDRGPAGSPTDPQAANLTPPLFRSFAPDSVPTRWFPRLVDLVRNTAVIGERLPTVARGLTFKCTARDEHSGPAGVIGGATSSDSVNLTVTGAAGPFRVTAPNSALTWPGGTPATVTWDVAGTTANGVNCALVNIRLSTDGGFTYPTVLGAGVPNSGSAVVPVPSVATTRARVLVEAADNYFFDISNADFTISSASVCAAPTGLTVDSVTSTTARVRFTAGAGGVSYLVSTFPATPPQTVTASPVRLTGLQPGTTYTVSVVGACGAGSTSVAVAASFNTPPLPVCSAPTELGLRDLFSTSTILDFVGSSQATSYVVSTVPAIPPQTITASPVVLAGLVPATTYTVSLVSNCGPGGVSAAATLTFTTSAPPPVNDQCAAALPLACGGSVSGTTLGATAPNDPTAACGGTGVDAGGVFYRLVGNGGRITLTTCDPATTYDTKLFVYTGACGTYTCVAGNDDTNAGGCNLSSTVDFASGSGVTYLVFVSGYERQTGNFGLSATCAAPTATPADLAFGSAFRVWPNPVGAAAALHVALAAPVPAATATLRNILGQRVGQYPFRGATTEVPTTGLAAGTYLLTVQVAGQAPVVRRVVIE